MNRQEMFHVFEPDQDLESIRKAAVQIRAEHGRWPSHYAIPRKGTPSNLEEFLASSGMAKMPKMVAMPSRIWLGFRETDNPIIKLPSWMKIEELPPSQKPSKPARKQARKAKKAARPAAKQPAKETPEARVIATFVVAGETLVLRTNNREEIEARIAELRHARE